MKLTNNKNRLPRCRLCTVLLLGALSMGELSLAMDGDGPGQEQNFIVGKWAYVRLENAHELIGQKKYKEATEVLDSLKRKKVLNNHERAMMWQTYGFVQSSQEKFSEAIESFEKCLSLNAMPEGATIEIEFNMGQLYLAVKQYKKAAATLNGWIQKVENPSANSLYLVAMAHAQNRDNKQALEFAYKAIDKAKIPQESWYQFVLSLHFQLNQFQKVAKNLEILVTRFPKKSYWLQLSSVYAKLKLNDKSFAVLELAYLQNYLDKESELLNLASLFMHHQIPYKAAQVLEKGIKSGVIRRTEKSLRMQAEALLGAKEPELAIAPLQEAAGLTDDGNLYVQLAQIHLGNEQWDKAQRALTKALQKKTLSDPATTYLLLGITRHNLEQWRPALNAFNKAYKHERTKQSAGQWIQIVQSKMTGT